MPASRCCCCSSSAVEAAAAADWGSLPAACLSAAHKRQQWQAGIQQVALHKFSRLARPNTTCDRHCMPWRVHAHTQTPTCIILQHVLHHLQAGMELHCLRPHSDKVLGQCCHWSMWMVRVCVCICVCVCAGMLVNS